MALAIGPGERGTAPLGRAVIGGLFRCHARNPVPAADRVWIVQKRASLKSPSLDPENPDSPFARKPENT